MSFPFRASDCSLTDSNKNNSKSLVSRSVFALSFSLGLLNVLTPNFNKSGTDIISEGKVLWANPMVSKSTFVSILGISLLASLYELKTLWQKKKLNEHEQAIFNIVFAQSICLFAQTIAQALAAFGDKALKAEFLSTAGYPLAMNLLGIIFTAASAITFSLSTYRYVIAKRESQSHKNLHNEANSIHDAKNYLDARFTERKELVNAALSGLFFGLTILSFAYPPVMAFAVITVCALWCLSIAYNWWQANELENKKGKLHSIGDVVTPEQLEEIENPPSIFSRVTDYFFKPDRKKSDVEEQSVEDHKHQFF